MVVPPLAIVEAVLPRHTIFSRGGGPPEETKGELFDIPRQIQTGKRVNSESARSAVASARSPQISRFTRCASGQSASTATARKDFSPISRLVISIRVA